jgi:DNA-binding NarL/FixJ family response regulator
MSAAIRVLVVDDDPLVRAGLAMILHAAPGLTLVGEAADGSEAVPAVDAYAPDVVLMDIRMPKLDGLAATELVRARPDPPEVIVLTTFHADEYVLRALRAGASGFLLKDTRPRELLNAIEVIAAGDALIAPGITRRLIAEFAARQDPTQPPAALAELTDREREILRLVAEGLSNAEIAGRLVISPLTAKTHVSNVLRKLDCHDRAALVALAYETGFITRGDAQSPERSPRHSAARRDNTSL